jgi:hypothetical protein
MNLSSNKYISLHYSRILSIPLLNNFLYIIQIQLYIQKKLYTFYCTSKNNDYKNRLYSLIKANKNVLICNSYLFGRDLYIFNTLVIANFNIDKKINTIKDIYLLMWTLTLCSGVTEKTKHSLASFPDLSVLISTF